MADGACVCWGVVWFLLLWFIGWPIAGFCAGFYILLLPLTVCIEGLKVSFHEFISNLVDRILIANLDFDVIRLNRKFSD